MTVCALNHRSTVCCSMYRFFPCNNCVHSHKVLFFRFSLNFLVHKCSSAQIVHRNIRRPIYRSAVSAQTDSKRSTKIVVNRLKSVIYCCVLYAWLKCTRISSFRLVRSVGDVQQASMSRYSRYSNTSSTMRYSMFLVQVDTPS